MLKKKKLLIVNGAQFGYSSGHYFYCMHLSENFDVNYICYDRGLKRLALEDVEVSYISFSGNKLERSLRFLRECIKLSFTIRPDILFVTYFNICFLLTVFCSYKKSVLDIRTGSLKENRIQRSIGNFTILIQSLFFKGVIILSDSLRKKLYISDKRSKIVPLGSEIYFKGNHSFNTLKLLYVGTFDNRNIELTIKGLHMFLQKNTMETIEAKYTIIGFGSDAEILKIITSISDENMKGTVKLEGRKTYEELRLYFEQSNIGIVFVPQTAGYDCQPVTKLFEYMLSGMYVIATNTFENRLMVNENNGILINDSAEDFCDGLVSIYNRRNSFNSTEIRKSAELYTWENIVSTNLKPFLLGLFK
jgi:glycosyltransferase involved in cell wall biosynthesis